MALDHRNGREPSRPPSPPTAASTTPDDAYYLGVVEAFVVSDSLKRALRESLKRAFDDPGAAEGRGCAQLGPSPSRPPSVPAPVLDF